MLAVAEQVLIVQATNIAYTQGFSSLSLDMAVVHRRTTVFFLFIPGTEARKKPHSDETCRNVTNTTTIKTEIESQPNLPTA